MMRIMKVRLAPVPKRFLPDSRGNYRVPFPLLQAASHPHPDSEMETRLANKSCEEVLDRKSVV
jgi:hypothetical protein